MKNTKGKIGLSWKPFHKRVHSEKSLFSIENQPQNICDQPSNENQTLEQPSDEFSETFQTNLTSKDCLKMLWFVYTAPIEEIERLMDIEDENGNPEPGKIAKLKKIPYFLDRTIRLLNNEKTGLARIRDLEKMFGIAENIDDASSNEIEIVFKQSSVDLHNSYEPTDT